MKLECIKNKIKEAVNLANKITGKNLTLPILSSILLIAKENSLKIRATNLDLGIEIRIPVKIEKEGITAVPGGIFNNFLSNIQENTVKLELKNNNLSISTKNSRTLIKSYPYEDFPTLPSIEQKKESFSISSDKFISGLKSVLYSAAISDVKPEISSVYIYTDSGNIVFVSTDSFRLAEKKIKLGNNKNISPLIIPFKNVSEILKVFDSISSDDITISFNNNQIFFESMGVYLVSRIIDGIFPDYKQILPKEFTTEAIILKQDFLNSLKMSNLFSDQFNQISVLIDPKNKIFELKSKNPDIGENIVRLDGTLSGETVQLNFNYKYIIDCFQSLPKDSLSLQLNGKTKPLVIRGIGDRSFTYLIMPLNQ